MRPHRWLSLLSAAFVAAASASAAAEIVVSDAWVRGTVPGQKVTGAFMRLASTADVTLVGVASPAAKIAEVHEMRHENGVMKMAAVPRLALTAGKPLLLQPGGYHVMLMEITQPLKDGDTVPITLTFEDRSGGKQTVEVRALVRPLGK